MDYKEYRFNDISVIEINESGVLINDLQDLYDIFSDVYSKKIIIKKENICEDFYDLKSGFASELLQKSESYKFRLGIIGDFSDITTPGFQDFIFESNNMKKIVFKSTVEEAVRIFCRKVKK